MPSIDRYIAERSATQVRTAFAGIVKLAKEKGIGHLFCFRGRRGDLLKVIWHGACLFTKRLERGRFLWPSVADGVVDDLTGATRLSAVGDRLAPSAGKLASDLDGVRILLATADGCDSIGP